MPFIIRQKRASMRLQKYATERENGLLKTSSLTGLVSLNYSKKKIQPR